MGGRRLFGFVMSLASAATGAGYATVLFEAGSYELYDWLTNFKIGSPDAAGGHPHLARGLGGWDGDAISQRDRRPKESNAVGYVNFRR
jgi:hypothetical protein